jgi:hypothetical protein
MKDKFLIAFVAVITVVYWAWFLTEGITWLAGLYK